MLINNSQYPTIWKVNGWVMCAVTLCMKWISSFHGSLRKSATELPVKVIWKLIIILAMPLETLSLWTSWTIWDRICVVSLLPSFLFHFHTCSFISRIVRITSWSPFIRKRTTTKMQITDGNSFYISAVVVAGFGCLTESIAFNCFSMQIVSLSPVSRVFRCTLPQQKRCVGEEKKCLEWDRVWMGRGIMIAIGLCRVRNRRDLCYGRWLDARKGNVSSLEILKITKRFSKLLKFDEFIAKKE